jgi:hypothetical protein
MYTASTRSTNETDDVVSSDGTRILRLKQYVVYRQDVDVSEVGVPQWKQSSGPKLSRTGVLQYFVD